MRHWIKYPALIALTVAIGVPLPANSQQKLLNILEQVNQGLSTVTGVPTKTGTPRLSVSTADPKIPEQKVGESDFSEEGMEIYFPKGKAAQSVALFNDALPVARETIGILSCTRANNDEQIRADIVLKRYEIEEGAKGSSWRAHNYPMGQFSYYDENLCLSIKKVVVEAPAANALSLTVTYLATDSLETTRQRLVYRKNYRDVWQLSEIRSAEY